MEDKMREKLKIIQNFTIFLQKSSIWALKFIPMGLCDNKGVCQDAQDHIWTNSEH